MTRPTLARRRFGLALARHRKELELGAQAVASHQGYSKAKLLGIEQGKHRTSKNDAEALLRFYQIKGREWSHLMALQAAGDQRNWNETSLPVESLLFLDLEAEADAILAYDPELIPAVLQEDTYLAALQEVEETDKKLAVEIRAGRASRRAATVDRPEPPTMRFVLGLAALAYLNKLDTAVRDQQLRRLRDAGERPSVEIRVIDRLHPAMDGAFTVLIPREAEGDVPIVYVETAHDRSFIETDDVVASYVSKFEQLCAKARPLEEYLHDREVA